MTFLTEIKVQPLQQTIRYGDGLLFLGSCFADEVGGICRGFGFDAMVNPFGVLYNPASIAQSVERLNSGKPFCHVDVIAVGEGQYCTFSHNTAFWQSDETSLLESVNKGLKEAHKRFLNAKWIIISLGTSWVYRHKETRQVVSNCHKLPARQFDREFLTMEQSTDCLAKMLQAYPDKQFIFTVSPLRHLKDGLHENQLSKAALLLAVGDVCKQFSNAHYFPAYEILLDELRDYRFYKEDMVHPTEQAVRYIWEHFVDFAIDPKEKTALQVAAELRQMLHHKPVFPESEAFRKFELLKEKKIGALKRDFPTVCINNLTE